MENYVVVATFLNEVNAELAQATLAAGGIESYLKYDDIGGMLPVLQEIGGVKVLVDPSNLEEARVLLSEKSTLEE
jgi:hypothetical protein